MTSSARGRSTGDRVDDLHRVGVDHRDAALGELGDEQLLAGRRQREARGLGADLDRRIDRAASPPSMPVTRTTVPSARFATNAVWLSAAITTLDGVAAGRDLRGARVVGGREHRQRAIVGVDHRDARAVLRQRDRARARSALQHGPACSGGGSSSAIVSPQPVTAIARRQPRRP